MSGPADKVALVYDHGVYLAFAQTLAQGFGEVRYCTNWRSFNSKSSKALTGEGMPGVHRVDSFWDNLVDADVVVFPFLGDADLQHYLAEQGYKVWGNRRAELLELDREGFQRLVQMMDLDVADTDRIEGMDALRDYMQDPENDDRYLKASFFRGDFETFHHKNWKLSEQWYDEKRLHLGPYGQEIVILSQEKLTGWEPGWDAYTVDGQFPREPMWGVEGKNKWYAGTYEKMPEELAFLAQHMSGPLKRFGARGNFHFEARLTETGSYLTDPTVRMASPAGEALCANISNWSDIVWWGSQGELVEPTYNALWAAQVVLKSSWSADHYMSVWVPPANRDKVYFHTARAYDGVVAVMPGEDEIFGSAVGLGETKEEAMAEALEVASTVEGYQVTYEENALREMKEEFKNG